MSKECLSIAQRDCEPHPTDKMAPSKHTCVEGTVNANDRLVVGLQSRHAKMFAECKNTFGGLPLPYVSRSRVCHSFVGLPVNQERKTMRGGLISAQF